MLKGAPEIVLGRCSHYLYNGVERPIDDEFRQEHGGAYERFGFMGERVIGACVWNEHNERGLFDSNI